MLRIVGYSGVGYAGLYCNNKLIDELVSSTAVFAGNVFITYNQILDTYRHTVWCTIIITKHSRLEGEA